MTSLRTVALPLAAIALLSTGAWASRHEGDHHEHDHRDHGHDKHHDQHHDHDSKRAGRSRDHHGRSHDDDRPTNEPDETAPRLASDPTDPREQRIAHLRQRLEEIVHDRPLGRTRIGVAVMDARDGDVLYAHNAERLFNPASNTKILTTAAAIDRLGGDYRYETRLVGPAPGEGGVVRGDVELRGSGDPSLTTQGLADLARDAAAHGVTRIEGALLVDGKFRDPARSPDPLGGGAIILNRNSYTIHVRPTENRHAAVVTLDPRSPEYFSVDDKVTTVSGRRTRLKLDGYRDNGRFVVVAKGRINPRAEFKEKEKLGDGAPWAAAVLRRALADYGIEIAGATRTAGLPSETNVIARHVSGPLAEICRVSNKDSNNFVADAIFKTLGREVYGPPTPEPSRRAKKAGALSDPSPSGVAQSLSAGIAVGITSAVSAGVSSALASTPGTLMQKGAKAVLSWLAPLGIAKVEGEGSWKIVNGSGLTRENRVQPLGLARLLRHLFLDLFVAPEFVTSLAIGGVDGTIKGRFGGSMTGRVRAKTGTLSNVSALSGYVGDRGDVLVFTILVDAFHGRKLEDVRAAQVRLVREMMAYLRSDRTAPPQTDVPASAPAAAAAPRSPAEAAPEVEHGQGAKQAQPTSGEPGDEADDTDSDDEAGGEGP